MHRTMANMDNRKLEMSLMKQQLLSKLFATDANSSTKVDI
jgi:hypothetical protein